MIYEIRENIALLRVFVLKIDIFQICSIVVLIEIQIVQFRTENFIFFFSYLLLTLYSHLQFATYSLRSSFIRDYKEINGMKQ